MIGLHTDGEYGHQAGEMNFALALTRFFGSNGLYVESEPGRGDFREVCHRALAEHGTQAPAEARLPLRPAGVSMAPRPDSAARAPRSRVTAEPVVARSAQVDMDVGRIFAFAGVSRRHHNKRNTTGITRISLDFRVIPMSKYDHSRDEGRKDKREHRFTLGEYLSSSRWGGGPPGHQVRG